MSKPENISPDDFPVEAEKNKVKTSTGKPIATATTPPLAAEIADRLNEQADQQEQDRWSA